MLNIFKGAIVIFAKITFFKGVCDIEFKITSQDLLLDLFMSQLIAVVEFARIAVAFPYSPRYTLLLDRSKSQN